MCYAYRTSKKCDHESCTILRLISRRICSRVVKNARINMLVNLSCHKHQDATSSIETHSDKKSSRTRLKRKAGDCILQKDGTEENAGYWRLTPTLISFLCYLQMISHGTASISPETILVASQLEDSGLSRPWRLWADIASHLSQPLGCKCNDGPRESHP